MAFKPKDYDKQSATNETFVKTNFTNVKTHDPKFHAKIQANELLPMIVY
jgi:hypothetical protein